MKKFKLLLSILLGLILNFSGFAQLRLPKVISNDMVLQRNQLVPIWGFDKPGTEISVNFKGKKVNAVTDAAGNWKVVLPKLSASNQPSEMVIKGSNTIVLKNILIGEVWLCSGQSNMEYPMKNKYAKPRRSVDSALFELSANNPQIRFFKVEKVLSDTLTTSGWKTCTDSTTIGNFSVIGYYFARNLHRELNVPIGILQAAWGGTRIEPWTSEEMYADLPAFKDFLNQKPALISGVRPGKHFQSMVKPLAPFALKGVLWYQGESNVMIHDELLYADKMQALVEGWRKTWSNKMPFYSVGIAPYYYTKRKDPIAHTTETLPKFWEGQQQSLKIPNTAMVWVTDLVDNLSDIHPPYKQDVAKRLSDLALSRDYGLKNKVISGPRYHSSKVKGNKIYLSFEASEGLKSRDGKALTWFTIAGADGIFEPADAKIEGNKVIVSNAKVPKPTQVRFAWSESAQPNFTNGVGLPAVPFRTDAANWNYIKPKSDLAKK
jgi:sialate O-acetylesterase